MTKSRTKKAKANKHNPPANTATTTIHSNCLKHQAAHRRHHRRGRVTHVTGTAADHVNISNLLRDWRRIQDRIVHANTSHGVELVPGVGQDEHDVIPVAAGPSSIRTHTSLTPNGRDDSPNTYQTGGSLSPQEIEEFKRAQRRAPPREPPSRRTWSAHPYYDSLPSSYIKWLTDWSTVDQCEPGDEHNRSTLLSLPVELLVTVSV
jgi:hypothetical protein